MIKTLFSKRPIYVKKAGLKATSLLTAVLFLLNTLFMSGIGAASVETAAVDAGTASSGSFLLALPKDFGDLKEYHAPLAAVSEKLPFIIHLQDAHSNPEAQENLKHIIDWLSKQPSMPAHVSEALTVAVEGALNELHPEYLEFFKEYPKVNEKVVQDLKEKGELNGAELYAWDLYRKGQFDKDLFRGVETAPLYRKNLTTYRALLDQQPEIDQLLKQLRSSWETASSKVLSKDLRNFLRERRQRKQGDYGTAQNTPQWEAYIAYLSQQSKEQLQIDLTDAFEQVRFPNLVRVLLLGELSKALNLETAQKQKEVFFHELKAKSAPSDQTSLDHFEALQPAADLRQQAEEIWSLALKAGMKAQDYSEFWRLAGQKILAAEVEADGLAYEMKTLEKWLTDTMAKTPAERRLVAIAEQFELVEKLLQLKVTRYDYQDFSDTRKKITDDFLGAGLRDFLENKDTVETAQAKVLQFVEQADSFYALAGKRDEALLENTLKAASGKKAAVLISGGFHSEGLIALMRERGLGFAVIQPKITKTDDGIRYRRVMQDKNADISAYFDKPSLNVQEAIFAKELLEVAFPELAKTPGLSAESAVLKTAEAINQNPVLTGRLQAESGKTNEQPSLNLTVTAGEKTVSGTEMAVGAGTIMAAGRLSSDFNKLYPAALPEAGASFITLGFQTTGNTAAFRLLARQKPLAGTAKSEVRSGEAQTTDFKVEVSRLEGTKASITVGFRKYSSINQPFNPLVTVEREIPLGIAPQDAADQIAASLAGTGSFSGLVYRISDGGAKAESEIKSGVTDRIQNFQWINLKNVPAEIAQALNELTPAAIERIVVAIGTLTVDQKRSIIGQLEKALAQHPPTVEERIYGGYFEEVREIEMPNPAYQELAALIATIQASLPGARSEVRAVMTDEELASANLLFSHLAVKSKDIPKDHALVVLGNPYENYAAAAVTVERELKSPEIVILGKGGAQVAENQRIRNEMILADASIASKIKGMDSVDTSMHTGQNVTALAQKFKDGALQSSNMVLTQIPTGMLLSLRIFQHQWAQNAASLGLTSVAPNFYTYPVDFPFGSLELGRPVTADELFYLNHAVGQIERLRNWSKGENPPFILQAGDLTAEVQQAESAVKQFLVRTLVNALMTMQDQVRGYPPQGQEVLYNQIPGVLEKLRAPNVSSVEIQAALTLRAKIQAAAGRSEVRGQAGDFLTNLGLRLTGKGVPPAEFKTALADLSAMFDQALQYLKPIKPTDANREFISSSIQAFETAQDLAQQMLTIANETGWKALPVNSVFKSLQEAHQVITQIYLPLQGNQRAAESGLGSLYGLKKQQERIFDLLKNYAQSFETIAATLTANPNYAQVLADAYSGLREAHLKYLEQKLIANSSAQDALSFFQVSPAVGSKPAALTEPAAYWAYGPNYNFTITYAGGGSKPYSDIRAAFKKLGGTEEREIRFSRFSNPTIESVLPAIKKLAAQSRSEVRIKDDEQSPVTDIAFQFPDDASWERVKKEDGVTEYKSRIVVERNSKKIELTAVRLHDQLYVQVGNAAYLLIPGTGGRFSLDLSTLNPFGNPALTELLDLTPEAAAKLYRFPLPTEPATEGETARLFPVDRTIYPKLVPGTVPADILNDARVLLNQWANQTSDEEVAKGYLQGLQALGVVALRGDERDYYDAQAILNRLFNMPAMAAHKLLIASIQNYLLLSYVGPNWEKWTKLGADLKKPKETAAPARAESVFERIPDAIRLPAGWNASDVEVIGAEALGEGSPEVQALATQPGDKAVDLGNAAITAAKVVSLVFGGGSATTVKKVMGQNKLVHPALKVTVNGEDKFISLLQARLGLIAGQNPNSHVDIVTSVGGPVEGESDRDVNQDLRASYAENLRTGKTGVVRQRSGFVLDPSGQVLKHPDGRVALVAENHLFALISLLTNKSRVLDHLTHTDGIVVAGNGDNILNYARPGHVGEILKAREAGKALATVAVTTLSAGDKKGGFAVKITYRNKSTGATHTQVEFREVGEFPTREDAAGEDKGYSGIKLNREKDKAAYEQALAKGYFIEDIFRNKKVAFNVAFYAIDLKLIAARIFGFNENDPSLLKKLEAIPDQEWVDKIFSVAEKVPATVQPAKGAPNENASSTVKGYMTEQAVQDFIVNGLPLLNLPGAPNPEVLLVTADRKDLFLPYKGTDQQPIDRLGDVVTGAPSQYDLIANMPRYAGVVEDLARQGLFIDLGNGQKVEKVIPVSLDEVKAAVADGKSHRERHELFSARSEVRRAEQEKEELTTALRPLYERFAQGDDLNQKVPHAFVAFGNPDFDSILNFAQKVPQGAHIYLVGGIGRGTRPLITATLEHYRDSSTGLISRLPEEDRALLEQGLQYNNVNETQVMRIILKQEGVTPEKASITAENIPSRTTTENFLNIQDQLAADLRLVEKPVVALASNPPLLLRLLTTANKMWAGKGWEVVRFKTYDKDLNQLTGLQLIELAGYLMGYSEKYAQQYNLRKWSDGNELKGYYDQAGVPEAQRDYSQVQAAVAALEKYIDALGAVYDANEKKWMLPGEEVPADFFDGSRQARSEVRSQIAHFAAQTYLPFWVGSPWHYGETPLKDVKDAKLVAAIERIIAGAAALQPGFQFPFDGRNEKRGVTELLIQLNVALNRQLFIPAHLFVDHNQGYFIAEVDVAREETVGSEKLTILHHDPLRHQSHGNVNFPAYQTGPFAFINTAQIAVDRDQHYDILFKMPVNPQPVIAVMQQFARRHKIPSIQEFRSIVLARGEAEEAAHAEDDILLNQTGDAYGSLRMRTRGIIDRIRPDSPLDQLIKKRFTPSQLAASRGLAEEIGANVRRSAKDGYPLDTFFDDLLTLAGYEKNKDIHDGIAPLIRVILLLSKIYNVSAVQIDANPPAISEIIKTLESKGRDPLEVIRAAYTEIFKESFLSEDEFRAVRQARSEVRVEEQIRQIMSLPETGLITLIVNTPFTESNDAVLNFLNSGRGNIVALKGPAGVFNEFYFDGHPKAVGVPEALARDAGIVIPENGILDPSGFQDAEKQALKAKILMLRDRLGLPMDAIDRLEKGKFAALGDRKKVKITDDLTVYANAHIFDLRVRDVQGNEHVIRTYQNSPVLTDKVEVLSVGPETLSKWKTMVQKSQAVIILGDAAPFADVVREIPEGQQRLELKESDVPVINNPDIWKAARSEVRKLTLNIGETPLFPGLSTLEAQRQAESRFKDADASRLGGAAKELAEAATGRILTSAKVLSGNLGISIEQALGVIVKAELMKAEAAGLGAEQIDQIVRKHLDAKDLKAMFGDHSGPFYNLRPVIKVSDLENDNTLYALAIFLAERQGRDTIRVYVRQDKADAQPFSGSDAVRTMERLREILDRLKLSRALSAGVQFVGADTTSIAADFEKSVSVGAAREYKSALWSQSAEDLDNIPFAPRRSFFNSRGVQAQTSFFLIPLVIEAADVDQWVVSQLDLVADRFGAGYAAQLAVKVAAMIAEIRAVSKAA